MDEQLASFCRPVGPDRHLLAIRVKPNAPRTRVLGINKDRAALEIAVHAAPQDGEANDELLRFLRETLAIPRAHLNLVSGPRSRDKVVEVNSPAAKIGKLLG
jgi:uncharacterized protein (TIGR00251 family)